jgi:raffinose/stachyose/melibiose transport system permease protein
MRAKRTDQKVSKKIKMKSHLYTNWFLMPSSIIYLVIFLLPTFLSFYFSLTIWNLTDARFVGLDNFELFFREPSLLHSIGNTLIFSFASTIPKVIFAVLFAVLLTSRLKSRNILRTIILFPYIVSTLVIGMVFSALMHPTNGMFNAVLNTFGLNPVDWLGNTDIALFSVVFVEVWRGVGVATIICIAGIQAIPRDYYEAVAIDGGGAASKFFHITLPLIRPAINSVIILSLIGCMRNFDLIWSMTRGGPGFATDVLASIIYKQYTQGFYGLATAGYVILFVIIAVIAFPLYKFLTSREADI